MNSGIAARVEYEWSFSIDLLSNTEDAAPDPA
jgi:hypothetical protein